jgi:hypothetical protein
MPMSPYVRSLRARIGNDVLEIPSVSVIFDGTLCASTYSNGDKVAWVSTVFGATAFHGTPTPDGRETLETRYVSRAEAAQLRCSPHVSHVLDIGFQAGSTAYFDPPTWRPAPA